MICCNEMNKNWGAAVMNRIKSHASFIVYSHSFTFTVYTVLHYDGTEMEVLNSWIECRKIDKTNMQYETVSLYVEDELEGRLQFDSLEFNFTDCKQKPSSPIPQWEYAHTHKQYTRLCCIDNFEHLTNLYFWVFF